MILVVYLIVLIFVGLGDICVGDVDSVVVGGKQGVGSLLVVVVFVVDFDFVGGVIVDGVWIGSNVEEFVGFVEQMDIGKVVVDIVEVIGDVEVDGDFNF